MEEHKTEKIPLKMIDVDIGIIPLIKWINSYKGIFTLYSCEGYDYNPETEVTLPPYVTFIAETSRDIELFLEELAGLRIPMEVKVDSNAPNKLFKMRFMIQFTDRDHLSVCLKMIESLGNN